MRLLMTLLAVLISLQAGSIEDFAIKNGYETSYTQAIAKAKSENKTLMLVMVTHYCPWCRKYEKNTLSKKSIKSLILKNYVPLIVNRQEHKFPDKFDTPRIPTTFFINPHNEGLIYSEMGYKTKSEFLEMQKRVQP